MGQQIAETGEMQMDASGDEATVRLLAQLAPATASGRPDIQHASQPVKPVMLSDVEKGSRTTHRSWGTSKVCLWDSGQIKQ